MSNLQIYFQDAKKFPISYYFTLPKYFLLKHKDRFGKSENLSKLFFAEILVFDQVYEGKSSSSNGLLWISFIYF